MSSEHSSATKDQQLLQVFFRLYLKPIIKEAISEFILEKKVNLTHHEQPSDRLLTSREVAKLLGVERHTISKMVRRGLSFVPIGNRTRRFKIDDINTFIEKEKRSR